MADKFVDNYIESEPDEWKRDQSFRVRGDFGYSSRPLREGKGRQLTGRQEVFLHLNPQEWNFRTRSGVRYYLEHAPYNLRYTPWFSQTPFGDYFWQRRFLDSLYWFIDHRNQGGIGEDWPFVWNRCDTCDREGGIIIRDLSHGFHPRECFYCFRDRLLDFIANDWEHAVGEYGDFDFDDWKLEELFRIRNVPRWEFGVVDYDFVEELYQVPEGAIEEAWQARQRVGALLALERMVERTAPMMTPQWTWAQQFQTEREVAQTLVDLATMIENEENQEQMIQVSSNQRVWN